MHGQPLGVCTLGVFSCLYIVLLAVLSTVIYHLFDILVLQNGCWK